MTESPDLIESILDIAPDSPLGALRRRRPEALRHAQGAYRALVLPADPGGVSHAERAALALRTALREDAMPLAARFRALLDPTGPEVAAADGLPGTVPAPRLAALLRYADRVALRPGATGQADIDALAALGLTPRDIVAVTQLVAFVPYQVRVLAGLQAMQQEAAREATTAPLPPAMAIAPGRFTQAVVGWHPRLPPVQAETATPAQLAALEACPPAQRRSTYFLTLAQDPASLGERGALFTTVMYAPRGLPRAERELATAVTSMRNGCVYCTSVHARRFAELTKDAPAMQRVLDGGVPAETDPRRRAIAEFADALTRSPANVTVADLAPLRAVGLDDLELLDLIHAIAMFANANRLMQALGDSEPSR